MRTCEAKSTGGKDNASRGDAYPRSALASRHRLWLDTLLTMLWGRVSVTSEMTMTVSRTDALMQAMIISGAVPTLPPRLSP
jgi:hypothetical protein